MVEKEQQNNYKVFLPCAGIGSRLGELAKDTPKSLLDVNGQSILERQISVFKKLGISDITVITKNPIFHLD